MTCACFHSRGIPAIAPAVSPPFQRLDDLASPEIRKRNLPHWESPGATYFITFRTADSLPTGIIREIKIRQQGWLRAHGLKSHEDISLLPLILQHEYQKLVNQREEQALNAGHGACPFRNFEHREILASLFTAPTASFTTSTTL